MNCKPGDLAVIVRAKTQHQHVGKIVRCVKPHSENTWVCNPDLLHANGNRIAWFDSHLRPLRNDPGQDETLTWKDVPSTDKVTA